MSNQHLLALFSFALAAGALAVGAGVRQDLRVVPDGVRRFMLHRGMHWLWLVPFLVCVTAGILLLLS